MNQEKTSINTIYEEYINKKTLTKEKLLRLGYTEEQINQLIKENKITKKENGEYALNLTDAFFNYHLNLMNNGSVKQAIACLEMCYEMDPHNIKVSFALMKTYVKTKQYNKVFSIFETLDSKPDKNFKQDMNLYLYLLSIVCNYPEKYRERVLKLTYSDIKTTDSKKYPEITEQNQLRTFLIEGKFSFAIYITKNKLAKLFPEFQERLFVEELFRQITAEEERKYLTLKNLIEYKKYEEIIRYMELKRKTKKIHYFDAVVYYLTKEIYNIQKTRIVPEVNEIKENTLKEILKSNNYKVLLHLIKNTNKFNLREKEILTMLIVDTIHLIAKVKEENKTNPNGYTRKKTIN